MAKRDKLPPKTLYSVHPGVAMMQKWLFELPEKTGRTIEEWVALVRESGLSEVKDRREWLKANYGLGTNSAWWIAERASTESGCVPEDDDPELYLAAAERYVESMFAGRRASLRPVYDALLALGLGTGPEAKACPCKTIVPLYRNRVFAEIKPATNTRIDLGLALGAGANATGRIQVIAGRPPSNRITHRIPIRSLNEIDIEVRKWLVTAYELDR
jgi:hypothetical protein